MNFLPGDFDDLSYPERGYDHTHFFQTDRKRQGTDYLHFLPVEFRHFSTVS